MKTLTDPNITVTGDKITICATISDIPFNGLLVTRVSHHYVNPEHQLHPRRIQSSNEAIFLEGPRGAKIAIPNSFTAAVAAAMEPDTTFTPVFAKGSTPMSVKIISEIPYIIQWQICDDPTPMATAPNTPPPAPVWTAIDGQSVDSLDDKLVPEGKWIRCVATNAAGSTISRPVQKT